MAPTRELAIQIYENAKIFVRGSAVQAQVAYGGTHVSTQKSRIAVSSSSKNTFLLSLSGEF